MDWSQERRGMIDLESNSVSLCGLIGIILYVPLFILTVYHYWTGYQLYGDQNLLQPKLIFYSSMAIYAFLETVYSINLMLSDG